LALVTLTTVGYGDKAPKTTSGRVVAGFSSITGLILLSMPIVILGTNVSINMKKMNERK
jgi:hypothetical protein